MKIPQPYYIYEINQIKDGHPTDTCPLGEYHVHIRYDPPRSTVPSLSSITGVLHAAGGSLLSITPEQPQNVAESEYSAFVIVCNGAPIINTAFCSDYTTIGIA